MSGILRWFFTIFGIVFFTACQGTPDGQEIVWDLPLITWETQVSVSEVPEDSSFCEIHWTLSRRYVFADTERVETLFSPKVITVWGEAAEVKIMTPEPFNTSLDSARITYQFFAGFDPKETHGFVCRAFPIRRKDGSGEIRSEVYIKEYGQMPFNAKQTLIFPKLRSLK